MTLTDRFQCTFDEEIVINKTRAERDDISVKCCICLLRGPLLKPSTDKAAPQAHPSTLALLNLAPMTQQTNAAKANASEPVETDATVQCARCLVAVHCGLPNHHMRNCLS